MSHPDPPINVVAIPYNASATIYWTAPNNNGGTINKYTVVSIPDNQMVVTPGETITNIFGLTNGMSYRFGVFATNKYGISDISVLSLPVIPIKKTLPLSPRNQVALTRPESAYLYWNSPSLNGGENIIKYTITRLDTGEKFIYNVFESNPYILYEYSYLWTGIDNNSEYYFSIYCSTSLGKSIDVFFNSVVPSPVPYPPTNVNITTIFNDLTSATVYWTPPVFNPIATDIINYGIVTEPAMSNTPLIVGRNNTSWVITGLDPGVAYYFYVYAINDAGISDYSNRAGPNQIINKFITIGYKPFITGGNDPSITKRMKYANSIGRLRKSQYINYGGGASFYT